jgi:N-acetylmuramoyl-L-alanine amidase
MKTIKIILFVCGLALVGLTQTAHASISTPQELQAVYNKSASLTAPGRKIRILLVPGHDNEYWGTQFRNVKEADLTLALTESLYSLLKKDPHFEVFTTRSSMATDPNSYTDEFSNYFVNQYQGIKDFIVSTRQYMHEQVTSGTIQKVSGVPHNTANDDVALRLFGINKWVNENNIDLVLHVHFNDAPGHSSTNPGPYRGFAVYIPESQYSNAAASRVYGSALYTQLKQYYSQSILPKEDAGLVEDQGLIAIGSANSLKSAVALVEYGYIYEPQFLDPVIRTSVIRDLAFQSYMGIHRFFGDQAKYSGTFQTPLLPYTWTNNVEYGALYNDDILHLQAALRYFDMYPASGDEELDCRMTGHFNPCTQTGLLAFQTKYKIPGGDGFTLGPKTRAKLNALFGK